VEWAWHEYAEHPVKNTTGPAWENSLTEPASCPNQSSELHGVPSSSGGGGMSSSIGAFCPYAALPL
jgi:hypothetical protein